LGRRHVRNCLGSSSSSARIAGRSNIGSPGRNGIGIASRSNIGSTGRNGIGIAGRSSNGNRFIPPSRLR
jgi:hypothetical protein